jgi:hypothetical protein
MISLSNIKCANVTISNIDQDAQATSQVDIAVDQQNSSVVSSSIVDDIDKRIQGLNPDAYETFYSRELNKLMNPIKGYDPNKVYNLYNECSKYVPENVESNSMFGFISFNDGNKYAPTCLNTTYELDPSLLTALELDNTFRIKEDEKNIGAVNLISNQIAQTNFASCSASASANNQIDVNNAICVVSNGKAGNFKMDKISQKAVAQLYMTCVFNQKNSSDIVNKITSKVSTKYNQVYDAIANNAIRKNSVEYYQKATNLFDTFVASNIERISVAAGSIAPIKAAPPKVVPVPVPDPDPVLEAKVSIEAPPAIIIPPKIVETPIIAQPIIVEEESDFFNDIIQLVTLPGLIGIICAIIIIIILLIYWLKKKA